MRSAASLSVFLGSLAASGLLALAAGTGDARAGMAAHLQETEVTTHRSQGEVRTIEGAKARLLRTGEGVFVDLETGALRPGHAYTLLLAVINDPAACEAMPCTPSDVLGRTAEIKADIVGVADGALVGEDGKARLASFQPVGDLPGAWFGNGLTNPEGAEIHLVVNDHGPFLPELGASMVTSYRAGCADDSVPGAFPDAAKADGEAGPNSCRLVQVAIFPPEGM